LLNWSLDETGQLKVERAVLSDMDCALKLEGEKLLDHRIGMLCGVARKDRWERELENPRKYFPSDSW
jgi:hypothetical protein